MQKRNNEDGRNAKRGLETEKEECGDIKKTKRPKITEKYIPRRKWKITEKNY